MTRGNENDLLRSGLNETHEKNPKTTGTETDIVAEGSNSDDPLRGIRRSETIADQVSFDSVRRELPAGWDVRPDLVQFGSEPLAETIRFRRTAADPQLVLKPVDAARPAGAIELYERDGPRTSRRATMTIDSLSEALRVAVNRIHQLNSR